MIAEAGSATEYAFALGVMAHYEGDTVGHPLGTNLAVPLIYPKLAAQYGDTVTYAESPSSHLQTEFRFDILQVAHRGEVPRLSSTESNSTCRRSFWMRVFAPEFMASG